MCTPLPQSQQSLSKKKSNTMLNQSQHDMLLPHCAPDLHQIITLLHKSASSVSFTSATMTHQMENYSYGGATYPDSGDSSPHSREIDFENPPPWEEQSTQPSGNYKVKLMCSYGGHITPRSHDNQLSYVGGETKILSVERNIKFASFVAKLSALCETDVCFKYQLPGEDLDALISVTNDDDLEHMMHEYDRLFRGMAKPARLRLFVFAVNGRNEVERPGSTELRTDRERFVEALNSGTNSIDGSSPPLRASSNVELLFEKSAAGLHMVSPPPLHPIVAPVPVIPIAPNVRVVGADPIEIQQRIQELQRMQIGNQQHEQVGGYQQQQQQLQQNRAPDVINNNAGDYYKVSEQKIPVQNLQQGYGGGGGYIDTPPQQQQQQPVYMIPTAQGNIYNMPIRAQNQPPATQGYYAPPQQPQQQQQLYRDQPPQQQMYNVVTSQAPPQPQQPKMVHAYPPQEMMRQNMMAESGGGGYAQPQVAYDGNGRQVYYTGQGGGAMQQTAYHQQQQGIAVSAAEMRSASGIGQEGKVVITKVP